MSAGRRRLWWRHLKARNDMEEVKEEIVNQDTEEDEEEDEDGRLKGEGR
tara:strand:- start:756 stop:902 length:147 start_codon:yes stop_codon:yes gene_type:complete